MDPHELDNLFSSSETPIGLDGSLGGFAGMPGGDEPLALDSLNEQLD